MAHPASAQNTAFVMDSEPGDFIGDGQNYYYTPADGTFLAQRNPGNAVAIYFQSDSGLMVCQFPPGQTEPPLTVGV